MNAAAATTPTQTLSEFLATDQAAHIAATSIAGMYGASANPEFGEVVTQALTVAAVDQDPNWLASDTATRIAREAAATIYGSGYERMFAMCALDDLRRALRG